jgi:hypothetical protein
MWTSQSFTNDEHVILSAYLLIPCILVVFSLALQHHVSRLKSAWLVPLSVPILIGLFVSAIVNVSGGYETHGAFSFELIGLSDSVFYFALLPPIIHNSGYALRRKDLVASGDAVCLLAFVGSVISLLFMAVVLKYACDNWIGVDISLLELIAFSSLMSSVDPVSALAVFSKLGVDPELYYLLLGESLFNDAICVTVFRSASKYVHVLCSSSLCLFVRSLTSHGTTLTTILPSLPPSLPPSINQSINRHRTILTLLITLQIHRHQPGRAFLQHCRSNRD